MQKGSHGEGEKRKWTRCGEEDAGTVRDRRRRGNESGERV